MEMSTLEVIDAFDQMEEDAVVELAKEGDVKALDYLLKKYKNFVRLKARPYYLVGADREDIIQEGMIGLFKAIRDYQNDKMTSFKSFADICVKRQMITAIKTASRQKHIPLNSYVSLNKPMFEEDSDRTLFDMMTNSNELNPEHVVIRQEEINQMELKINETLSNLECQVINAYLEGQSYQEIAENVNRDVKSIDNALQRVKKKLENVVTIDD